MKTHSCIAAGLLLILLLAPSVSSAETGSRPTIKDLDFLLGDWDITLEIYDTHDPERGLLIIEKGTQSCKPELEERGEPQFITCVGEVTAAADSPYQAGRTREFREAISYNRFLGSFERIGQFSNWPSHSQEILQYHAASRTIEIKGQLPVQDGMMERYEDIYTFSEDFTSYERVNKANFSDMPVTVFNITLKGTGTRISK